jgi:hypothetical protein
LKEKYKIMASQSVIELANKIAKLPFFADFDAEASLASYKEKIAPTSPGGLVNASQLKEIFLALGYDKAPPPPEAPVEGEEKKEEVPPGEVTKFAETTFALIDTQNVGTLHIAKVLGTIMLSKSGYGEPLLRFAVKCTTTDESGSLKEPEMNLALSVASSASLNEATRTNLRRAWRLAAKFEPPQPEPPAEGEEPKPAVVVAPEDIAVMVDDFISKLSEDAALQLVFTKEIPVPLEAPPAPAE